MSLRNRIERLEGRRQPDQEPQIIRIVGVAPDGRETCLGAMIVDSGGSAARCFDGEGYELIHPGGPRLDPPHRVDLDSPP